MNRKETKKAAEGKNVFVGQSEGANPVTPVEYIKHKHEFFQEFTIHPKIKADIHKYLSGVKADFVTRNRKLYPNVTVAAKSTNTWNASITGQELGS